MGLYIHTLAPYDLLHLITRGVGTKMDAITQIRPMFDSSDRQQFRAGFQTLEYLVDVTMQRDC